MHYIGCGITDAGAKKKINQDSICLIISDTNNKGQVILAVVCDGIGGLEQGELASSATTKKFAEWYRDTLPKVISSFAFELIQSEWSRIISEMNYKLLQYGRKQGIRLGTTLTAMMIFDDKYMIAQVGDTRAYSIQNGIRQITEDHTYFNRELKAGNRDRYSLMIDPRRNRITRGIGISEKVSPDFYFGTIDPEEQVWMLCSDGFRRKIKNHEFNDLINPYLLDNKQELEALAVELVDMVKCRGEKDNISVILIKATGSKQ